MSGEFYEFLQNGGREFLRFQVRRSAYKQALFMRIGCSFDEAWGKLGNALRILAREPSTLLHGDAHVGNTYVLPGDRVGLLDWQLMGRGSWCHDVAYIMVTSLDVECRRRRERDLLGYYLERLRAGGVPDAPAFDDAWLLYRQAAMWGFLVGWMITPVENYGEAILRANLERLTAAMEDLETLSALSE